MPHKKVRFAYSSSPLTPRHGFPISPAGLTKREIDTLRLIARGATHREGGATLGIAKSTAHEHFETAKKN
jgi:DNA-binding CsgD family transcriptional regulator